MPVYVYECPGCGARCEKLRSMKRMDAPVACGECGSQCERRFSAANYAFKKGWIPTSEGWKYGTGEEQ